MALIAKIKREIWAFKQREEFARLGLYGLELYRYLEDYTGDPNPWIENPYGVFCCGKDDYVVIANQVTGAITLLYK